MWESLLELVWELVSGQVSVLESEKVLVLALASGQAWELVSESASGRAWELVSEWESESAMVLMMNPQAVKQTRQTLAPGRRKKAEYESAAR